MGWHRVEKTLWPSVGGYAQTDARRAAVAHQLVADTVDPSGPRE